MNRRHKTIKPVSLIILLAFMAFSIGGCTTKNLPTQKTDYDVIIIGA